MASQVPLKILSLDGGGIRGISSLLILEDIMERIREIKGLDKIPRPCEFFDLIGGTSTGGIIAIMLGRLGMTVDECIRAYKKVARQAFTPKWTSLLPAPPTGAFSAKALEAAIKQTTREFCVESQCVARRSKGNSAVEACLHSDIAFRDGSCTKTVVLAITKENVDAPPTLFKTYDTSASLNSCTIWQVARATSAATTFFKSIKVGRDEIEFVDAGFGYNNPCEILIEEARRQFPDRRQMRVLSIGTGLGDVVTIGNTRFSIINTLKKMATSSKQVAARLDRRYGDDGQYYRLNVDQGLQDITLSDWDKASRISAHTRNYITENERAIKKLVENFTGIDQAGDARELGGTPINRAALLRHYIPFHQNQRFVGRDETLNTLRDVLFIQGSHRAALVGLGGVGKTQVALEFAYWTKRNKPDHSIFWVSALSDATFEQAYVEIARILSIQRRSEDEDLKELVRRYLSLDTAGPWLLILDNADDMDMLRTMIQYLPKSDGGLIFVTTRSRDVALSVADGVIVELHEMSLREAKSVLQKWLTTEDLGDDAVVAELLGELTYLPLAIAQAAAYLKRNQVSITTYLGLLRGTEKDMVSLMSREFHDGMQDVGPRNAVATTWLVSFDQIHKSDSAAANLLSFMSQIEPKAIPQSILPGLGSTEQMVHAIGTLCGYAFLGRRGEGDMFDMHRLVHIATRVWIERHERVRETKIETIQHLSTIFSSANGANREKWRAYLPHALRALQESKDCRIEERYDLFFRVGDCLYMDRRFREAMRSFTEVYQWRKKHLAEEDHFRLISEHALASTYLNDRRTKEAIEILEHVVAVRKKTLAEEDHFRLTSEHELARAYLDDRRIKEAIKIFEHVVAVRKKTVAEEDYYRLGSEHELASAYLEDQRIKEAIEIFEHVVAVQKKTLAEEDHFRLTSEHALARAYLDDRRIKKAIEIFEYIVVLRKKTLAEEDHFRLGSEHALASAYLNDRRIKEAIEIFEHIVAVQKTLAEEDHFRLTSEHELARAYFNNRQIKEAIEILEHVVAVRKKTLAEEDHYRIGSESYLAYVLQMANINGVL